GLTVIVTVDEWPSVVIEVNNGSAERFQGFADRMLHAVVLGADGIVRPLIPTDVTLLTVDVAPHESAQYQFSALGAPPQGEASLIVTAYPALKGESDIQGTAVYGLPTAQGEWSSPGAVASCSPSWTIDCGGIVPSNGRLASIPAATSVSS